MIIKVPRHGRPLLPVFNLYQTHKGPFSFQTRLDFLTFGESLNTSSKSDEKGSIYPSLVSCITYESVRWDGTSANTSRFQPSKSFSPSQCPESCVLACVRACVLQQRSDLSRRYDPDLHCSSRMSREPVCTRTGACRTLQQAAHELLSTSQKTAWAV